MAESLAHIPFSPADERVLTDTARWMRFMGVVLVVMGIIGTVATVLALGALTLFFGALAALVPAGVDTAAVGVALGVAFVILAATVAMSLVEGTQLYRAADDLRAVAETDADDQGHLARAFRRLRIFFALEVGLGLLTLLSSFGGAQ